MNNLQTFLNSTALQPGDTVFIRRGSGTYVSKAAGSGYETEGFNIKSSGTATSPITISNYPGESPLIANCADNENTLDSCPRWSMSAYNQSYVRFTGFRIRGGLRIEGGQGNVVDHMEITVGHETTGSGNWATLRLEQMTGAWIHHNYIHDVVPLSGYTSGDTNANSCIKLFTAVNSTVEWNTFNNCSHSGGAGAIDDKQDSVNNTYRYNRFTANTMAFRLQAQGSQSAHGTRVYQNVIDATGASPAGGTCIWIADGTITGVDVFQNTVSGYADGVVTASGTVSGTITTKIYNNILSVSSRNTAGYDSSRNPALQDYNAYTAGRSSWPTGGSYDTHTLLLSSFGFVSGSDFHLTSGSTCKNAGRTGGVVSGTVVDMGAYASGITCVGHACGSTGTSGAAPQPPGGVRVIR